METPQRQERQAKPSKGANSGDLGRAGERLAASWLEAHGLRVLGRNWRRGDALGAPEEAITLRKRRHLILAAQSYIAELAGDEERPYRIDVVAVQLAPSGKLLEIRHYPSAVALEE